MCERNAPPTREDAPARMNLEGLDRIGLEPSSHCYSTNRCEIQLISGDQCQFHVLFANHNDDVTQTNQTKFMDKGQCRGTMVVHSCRSRCITGNW